MSNNFITRRNEFQEELKNKTTIERIKLEKMYKDVLEGYKNDYWKINRFQNQSRVIFLFTIIINKIKKKKRGKNFWIAFPKKLGMYSQAN